MFFRRPIGMHQRASACEDQPFMIVRGSAGGVEGGDEGVGVVGKGVGAVGGYVDYDDVEAGDQVDLHGVDEGIGGATYACAATVVYHLKRVGVRLGAGLDFDKHNLIALESYDVELSETIHAAVALMDCVAIDKEVVGGYRLSLSSELIMNGHGRRGCCGKRTTARGQCGGGQ